MTGMPDRAALRSAVGAVRDPELGDVTLDDLGMVRDVRVGPGGVAVELVATFLGCPARGVIEADVHRAVAPHRAEIRWLLEAWHESSVTPSGRERLAAIGVVVGDAPCPRCTGALRVLLPVGTASCRSVARCTGCGELVDVLRGPSSNVRWAEGTVSYAHI